MTGAASTAGIISSMTITSGGVLYANGGMNFATNATNNTTKYIITSAGTGRINLKGALNAPANSITYTAGTAGAVFNYADTSSTQTVTIFPGGGYFNLYLNNTTAGGASLLALIANTNVTGNICVQSGTFKNGGFSITGLGTRTFQVDNGAAFEMSGASTYPTGFGTFTYGPTSTVRYLQTTNPLTLTAATYGNLDLKPAGTAQQNFPAATININGNLTIGDGVNLTTVSANTAATILNVYSTVTIALKGMFVLHATNPMMVGGDWRSKGRTVAGTASINFSSTTAQIVNNAGQGFGNIVSSNTSTSGLTFTSSFTATQLYVNAIQLPNSATVYFAGNSSCTISTFTIYGSASNPVVLKSTSSDLWYLNVTS